MLFLRMKSYGNGCSGVPRLARLDVGMMLCTILRRIKLSVNIFSNICLARVFGGKRRSEWLYCYLEVNNFIKLDESGP